MKLKLWFGNVRGEIFHRGDETENIGSAVKTFEIVNADNASAFKRSLFT